MGWVIIEFPEISSFVLKVWNLYPLGKLQFGEKCRRVEEDKALRKPIALDLLKSDFDCLDYWN